PEEGRSAHRRREQNHLRLEIERRLTNSMLHRSIDRTHLRRRNLISDLKSRPKSFIDFGRTEKVKRHLAAAGAVNVEYGRTEKPRILLKQAQWLPVLAKSGQETRVLLSSKLDDTQLRDHDRPAEDRGDGKKTQDEFAGDGGVLESKEQAARCNQVRNEHFSFTRLSNNEFRRKRYLSFRPERSGVEKSRRRYRKVKLRDSSTSLGMTNELNRQLFRERRAHPGRNNKTETDCDQEEREKLPACHSCD